MGSGLDQKLKKKKKKLVSLAEDLREGLILVGVARCIAMVLVWTDISNGDLDCAGKFPLLAVLPPISLTFFSFSFTRLCCPRRVQLVTANRSLRSSIDFLHSGPLQQSFE
jgi:hypothetical protein